jgi:hypothetical protein
MSNPKTVTVFKDLEAFQAFCKEFGFKYEPADLYSNHSYVWRLYNQKYLAGKQVTNMWDVDAKRLEKRSRR